MTKAEERLAGDTSQREDAELSEIIRPSYYKQGIEVIDFIDSYELNFSLGNAVKYIVRAGEKERETVEEALRKAIWYLEHEIKRMKALEAERLERDCSQ